VVGSLLRPRKLLQARERLERGEIGPPEFKPVEDAAVAEVIRLQEGIGLAVVTDGEMRHLSFQSQLTEAVEGFSDWDPDAFLSGDEPLGLQLEGVTGRPARAMEQRVYLDMRDVEQHRDATRDGRLACAGCAGHQDPPRTHGQGCHGVEDGHHPT
jgi:hypothetical protein